MRTGLLHGGNIKVSVHPCRAPFEEGVLGVVNEVGVPALHCVEPRMGFVAHGVDGRDADVGRQHAIEFHDGLLPRRHASSQRLIWQLGVGHKVLRVHAGVSSTTPHDRTRPAKEAGLCVLQHRLNGDGFRLSLPPVVPGAVVRQFKKDPHQRVMPKRRSSRSCILQRTTCP